MQFMIKVTCYLESRLYIIFCKIFLHIPPYYFNTIIVQYIIAKYLISTDPNFSEFTMNVMLEALVNTKF